MGLSTAGVAFRPNLSTFSELKLVQTVFGKNVSPLPEMQNPHDIRVPGNVAIESRNGATFVYNSEIADKILFEGRSLQPSVYGLLERQKL